LTVLARWCQVTNLTRTITQKWLNTPLMKFIYIKYFINIVWNTQKWLSTPTQTLQTKKCLSQKIFLTYNRCESHLIAIDTCETEVSKFDLHPWGVYQDVLWLEVSVYDTVGVDEVHAWQYLMKYMLKTKPSHTCYFNIYDYIYEYIIQWINYKYLKFVAKIFNFFASIIVLSLGYKMNQILSIISMQCIWNPLLY